MVLGIDNGMFGFVYLKINLYCEIMLIPDEKYFKEDIYKALSIPPEKQKGPWNTGYVKYDGSYYIFANIGIAGRTGHNYNNHWEGKDLLIWYGKNKSHLGQKSIQELLSKKVPVHIFTRREDRSPFLYHGLAIANRYEVEEQMPIMIAWDLIKTVGERETDEAIQDIIINTEAPNDVLKRLVATLKRFRDGQKKLKNNLIQLYDGACCITGSSVEEVLIACHIEPHAVRGNNQSTNGLLMRADLHILFDTNLIGIEPDTLKVRVGNKLKRSEYEYLDGIVLRGRKDGIKPDKEVLLERWEEFKRVSCP